MQKRILLGIFVIAIVSIILYVVMTRDEHSPSIFDQKTWPSSPTKLERDFWNFLAAPR